MLVCFGGGDVDWEALAASVQARRSGCPQMQELNHHLVAEINTLANSSAKRVPVALRRRLVQAGVTRIPRR